jgi:hypothetical protein
VLDRVNEEVRARNNGPKARERLEDDGEERRSFLRGMNRSFFGTPSSSTLAIRERKE